MVVSTEELKEEQLDLNIVRMLKRDWADERIDMWETVRELRDLRRAAHLIEIERRKGYSQKLEAKKKRLFNDAITFLVRRKQVLNQELRDLQQELSQLGVEEREEGRLLRGR